MRLAGYTIRLSFIHAKLNYFCLNDSVDFCNVAHVMRVHVYLWCGMDLSVVEGLPPFVCVCARCVCEMMAARDVIHRNECE